jgi:hypothetical protein
MDMNAHRSKPLPNGGVRERAEEIGLLVTDDTHGGHVDGSR